MQIESRRLGAKKVVTTAVEKAALAGEGSELLVQQADEFFLVQAIHKATHQRAQIGCHGSHGLSVAGNIGEE